METIKCFGIAAEITGKKELVFSFASMDIATLRLKLGASYPGLNSIKSYMIAVNQEYANDQYLLKEGDEVAIIPPVSGG